MLPLSRFSLPCLSLTHVPCSFPVSGFLLIICCSVPLSLFFSLFFISMFLGVESKEEGLRKEVEREIKMQIFLFLFGGCVEGGYCSSLSSWG